MPPPLPGRRAGPADALLRGPVFNSLGFALGAMLHPVCPAIHPTGVSLGTAFALLRQARMVGVCAGGFDPVGPGFGLVSVLARRVCALFNPLHALFSGGGRRPGGGGGPRPVRG